MSKNSEIFRALIKMPSKLQAVEFGLQRALDQDLLATLESYNCLKTEFALLH